jgi:hypothetical protein
MTIGIIGHRDIKEDQEQRVREEIAKVLEYFKSSANQIKAISLVASGADTIFYEVAKAHHLPVEVFLPFQLEIYQDDFTEAEDLKKFKTIAVEQQLKDKEPLGLLHTDSKEERDQAYFNAGKFLVDQSDQVIAVWDGKSSNGQGGTADVVRYAEEKGKPLVYIKVQREKMNLKDLEKDAGNTKRIFKLTGALGILFGLLSVLCFAPTLIFEEEMISGFKMTLAVGELIFLPTSYFLLCFYTKMYKKLYLQKRIAAEQQRVYEAYKHAGVPMPPGNGVNFSPDVDSKYVRQIKNIADPDRARKKMREFVQQQIEYHYDQRVKKYTKYQKSMHLAQNIIVALFVTTVLINFLTEWNHYLHKPEDPNPGSLLDKLTKPLHLLWVIFPSIYAALEVVSYFEEWNVNIAVSQKIINSLEEIKTNVMIAEAEGFSKAMVALRHALEIENEIWATLIKHKHIGAYI